EQDPRLRYAVMAHGSDLYTERHANGRIPYRAWQVRQADRVICIARHGADYLRARFPAHAGKVEVAHLGTMDHGPGPWAPADALRIVSCAYLRPPKRIHLLARALAQVRRPVHWTHFGDGPDRSALDEAVAALPPHITVDMPGNVVPEEVIAWYRRNPADLFVHLSGHEGVPVAMMEAISFGIPVWANDVGGVAELLRPPAGKLLPADIDPARLAALLDGPEADHWRQAEVRRDVRAYWQEQFSAEANFVRIVSQASSL
ncbi:MAG: glycosyltransferase, partial [Flavobacteriales bacterium]|nr:glycosyltransferase [Flavobacteriales bacterium]